MSENWTPDSWRSKPVLQVPDYPDEIKLEEVQQKLTGFPPLVFAGEARRLKSDLKKVSELDSSLSVICIKELKNIEELEKEKDKIDKELLRGLF